MVPLVYRDVESSSLRLMFVISNEAGAAAVTPTEDFAEDGVQGVRYRVTVR